MKKTFSINLGHRMYHIDEDAYLLLKDYLERIESYFSDQKEREDILNDIEARISELFQKWMGPNREVVTVKEVKESITIMGDPSLIGGVQNQQREHTYNRQGPSRIYRDPDDRIIGGVCSGLGAYVGIDPVFVRILFVLFLIFGIGFLVYLILWVAVPEAKTTAQKLEMRGDPVNASNIGKFVADEYESIKNSFRKKK
jgi:phage shock protein PspC (stress-responsive transcriptional regulator)